MYMTNLIDAHGVELSDREKVFRDQGFDCYPRDGKSVCFRQFYKISDLQPMMAQRLKRMGAKPADEISLCFSEADNLVSACVLPRDIFMEFAADSQDGVNLLWSFGLEL